MHWRWVWGAGRIGGPDTTMGGPCLPLQLSGPPSLLARPSNPSYPPHHPSSPSALAFCPLPTHPTCPAHPSTCPTCPPMPFTSTQMHPFHTCVNPTHVASIMSPHRVPHHLPAIPHGHRHIHPHMATTMHPAYDRAHHASGPTQTTSSMCPYISCLPTCRAYPFYAFFPWTHPAQPQTHPAANQCIFPVPGHLRMCPFPLPVRVSHPCTHPAHAPMPPARPFLLAALACLPPVDMSCPSLTCCPCPLTTPVCAAILTYAVLPLAVHLAHLPAGSLYVV